MNMKSCGYIAKQVSRHEMRVATKDTDTCMSIYTYKTWIFRLAEIRSGLLYQFLV